uniref:Chemotaxis protein n=1 Tax=Ascaris lumbricoides TaxID=6252 RepID=A0A0M3IH60_ASCLU
NIEELETKFKDAHIIVEKSKGVFDDVTRALKSEGRKLTANALRTAETTLKGAGDENIEELETKFKDAHIIVEKSKGVFDDVTRALKSEGRKLTANALRTAETTLKGAGDEVEGFFSEVPNTVGEGGATGRFYSPHV